MGEDQRVKILFVEDLPSDVEFARREIANEGIGFESVLVETEPDFRKALKEFGPDIIVSDYSMPEFDGMSALIITRQQPDYIPFIVLTGSMNEETAVKCMKAGANDYVIKEQIKRLPYAILEALDHKKSRDEKEYMQTRLRETMEEYRDLINGMTETVWIIDLHGKILDVNGPAEPVLGYSREELLKIGLTGVDKNLTEEQISGLAASMVREKRQYFQTVHTARSGRQIPVEINSTLVNYHGETAILSVARDITDRIRLENIRKFLVEISQLSMENVSLQKYLESIHHKLNKILKADNFFIALYDKETGLYTFPYHVDEYDGMGDDEPVNLNNTLTDYIRKTGEARLITTEDEKGLHENHGIRLVGEPSPIWMGAPLVDSSSGEVIGTIALQDYHNKDAYSDQDLETLNLVAGNIGIFIERLSNLEKLRKSESNYKYLFENNPHPMWVYDLETLDFLEANNTAVSKYGYSHEEFLAMKLTNIRPEEDVDKLLENIKSEQEKIQQSGPWRHRLKNGEIILVEIHSHAITFNGRKARMAIAKDITERKKFEEDLIVAKEKAEESDRLKSAFLANMSHEIRTPMNGIMGFLELIRDPDINSEERNKYLEVVEKSSERLLNTINDIIELSKIESGQVEVQTEDVDISELMKYYYDFFKPEAIRCNLELKLNPMIPAELQWVKTDKNKLESILGNFLKNALKFTREGYIELGCRPRNGRMEFYVQDSGPGVRQDRKEAIFERFVQADLKITRAHEGSGLGLSIAKEYAKMLGAEIGLESPKEGGSRFFVLVPFTPADKPGEKTPDQETHKNPDPNKQTILVVEDDPDSTELLSIILAGAGFDLLFADNGLEAVKKFGENRNKIDLILMDMKMPVMDGYEATRKIRETGSKVPILAQTAFALVGDSQKAITAGCNEYLAKPVSKKNLLRGISRLLADAE